MKHAIEIDMTDGPVAATALYEAVVDAPDNAVVLVTRKPEHLTMGVDPYARGNVVIRVEWDAEAKP